jgi:hypothetical protein
MMEAAVEAGNAATYWSGLREPFFALASVPEQCDGKDTDESEFSELTVQRE